jgi:hypothetical protein
LHSSEVLSAIPQHENYTTNTRGPRLTALPKYTSAFDDNEEDTDGKKKSVTDLSDVATIDGMEVLLLAIATYRKSDPTVEVQCEFLENAFDILSASLLREDNVTDFVEAEGIELMLRCVRQKVHAGVGHYGCLTLHCRDHPPPLPWRIAMTTTPTEAHARNSYTLVESSYCFHCACHESWQYRVRHHVIK